MPGIPIDWVVNHSQCLAILISRGFDVRNFCPSEDRLFRKFLLPKSFTMSRCRQTSGFGAKAAEGFDPRNRHASVVIVSESKCRWSGAKVLICFGIKEPARSGCESHYMMRLI